MATLELLQAAIRREAGEHKDQNQPEK